jgi:hypothetical protein
MKVKVLSRPMVSRPVCLGVKTHLGSKTRFWILSDMCGLFDVGCPLSRETGLSLQLILAIASAVILRSFSRETHNHILLSQIRDSLNPVGQVRVFIYPQEQGGPVTPPETGFPFRRLLRFAGTRQKYLKSPPHVRDVISSQNQVNVML